MPPSLHNAEKQATPRVDAHHHLWQYNKAEFGWLTDDMQSIRRDFLPDELNRLLAAEQIEGSVVVQTRQTLEETEWLLTLAHAEDKIFGVVGWAPLAHLDIASLLERLAAQPKLVGLRHVVQAESPSFLDGDAFNRGISHLHRASLVYDILIYEHQLEEAIRFVDRHPNQIFVLDHCAKPRIAAVELEPWRRHLLELGKRPNVSCKLSGLVTEADWKHWTLDSLTPYFDTAFEAFGADRLMAGSDWPVCLVATSYSHWWHTLRQYAAKWSETERAQVMGATAQRVYRLQPTTRSVDPSCS